MNLRRVSVVLLSVTLTLAIIACGGGDDDSSAEGDGTPTAATQQQVPAGSEQTPGATGPDATTPIGEIPGPTSTVPLTQEQILALGPNELGQVPILEYHHIGEMAEQFIRTPDQ